MTDIYSQDKRSEIMGKIGASGTEPEMAVREVVGGLGVEYVVNRKDLPGKPDVVLPDRNLVIFVHGCFWHRHDCLKATLPESNQEFWTKKFARNRERDQEVEEELESMGWSVAVIWECQTTPSEILVDRITQILERNISEGA